MVGARPYTIDPELTGASHNCAKPIPQGQAMYESGFQAAQHATALSDWLLTGTSMSAVIGGGFAFYRYVMERRKDRDQRKDELEQRRVELRWRQAQAAKQLLDELFDDTKAEAALDMLDSESRAFEIVPGQRQVITTAQWLAALRFAPDTVNAPLEMFVRDSFDSLFYHMALFDHYIARAFIRFEDIAFPMSYYVKIMAEDVPVYKGYLSQYGLAAPFLDRFPDWLKASR